jgi:hypothetical protein
MPVASKSRGPDRARVRILTVDPTNRRIDGGLRDGGVIQISVLSSGSLFRWPKEGEQWTVVRRNNTWLLDSLIETGEVNQPIEDLEAGQAKLQATNLCNDEGIPFLREGDATPITESEVTGLIDDLAAKQPLDSDLTAIASLSTTPFGRAFLTLASAGTARTYIDAAQTSHSHAESDIVNLVSDLAGKQPLDSDLTAIAALSTTSFGRSLLTVIDASAGRSAIGASAQIVINVKDYGAIGDGTTDDTAAIVAAKAALGANGGTIFFPAGTYKFTTLDFHDSRSIRLQGVGGLSGGATPGTMLKSPTSGSGRIIDARSSFGLQITDMMIGYDSGSFTGTLIDYGHSATGGDSSYMSLERCFLTGLGVRGAAALVDLTNAIIGSFTETVFTQAARGVRGRSINTDYSNAHTFRGCTFLANVTSHVTNPSQGWSFYGCTFENLVTSLNVAAGAGALSFDSSCSGIGITFDGCWMGDATATGNWISFTGSGLNVRGCYISTGVKAIAIAGSSNFGINITGNQFSTLTTAVDLGTGQTHCTVLSNDYQSCTNRIIAGDFPSASVVEHPLNGASTDLFNITGNAFALGTFSLLNAPTAAAHAVTKAWAEANFASPSATINAGDAASAGTATTAMRSDAQMAVSTASTAAVQSGSAAEGTATSLARSDHTHSSDTTRAPLASPTLTGTPAGPTAAVDTNTTQLATTAYVIGQAYAKLASPTLTGTPAAPTAAVDTNTTQLATTAFVLGQVGTATALMDGVASSGSSLRYARVDHRHPTDTSLAPLASPTFTGTPAAPTAAAGTNTTQLATTAFVTTAIKGAAFGAYRSTNGSAIASLASALLFNVVDYDKESDFNSATGKFTARAAGVHHFDATVLGAGTYATTTFLQIELWKNGAAYRAADYHVGTNTSDADSRQISIDLNLAVNDTIEVRMYISTGNFTVYGSATPRSYFSGHLVRAD